MNSITVLGSGDTLGTPVAGCTYPSCVDLNPKSKRFRFGLLLEIKGKKILVDANPDLKWQSMQSNFELKDIDVVLITHTHSDHVNGLGEFFYRRPIQIPIYCLDHPLTCRQMDYFRYLEIEKILKFRTYDNYVPFWPVGNIKVTPIELNHGYPCSGFVVEFDGKKIGIVSDTNLVLKDSSIKMLNACDYLLSDTFSENLDQVNQVYQDCGIDCPEKNTNWFHMTIAEAQQLLRVTNSKKLVTVHMSRFMPPHQQLVDRYQTDNFIIGYDNYKINI